MFYHDNVLLADKITTQSIGGNSLLLQPDPILLTNDVIN